MLSRNWAGTLWKHYRRNDSTLPRGEALQSIYLFEDFLANHSNIVKNLTLLLMDVVRILFGINYDY